MSHKKDPVSMTRPYFRFGESPFYEFWVKHRLMYGDSVEIVAAEHAHPRELLITTFDYGQWSYEELVARARDESGLGMHTLLHQYVTQLGADTQASRIINETLEAGFRAHLVAEETSQGGVSGYYTLIAAISDNS